MRGDDRAVVGGLEIVDPVPDAGEGLVSVLVRGVKGVKRAA